MQQIDSDLLGYAAAGLVLLTFSVRSIAALRSVAAFRAASVTTREAGKLPFATGGSWPVAA
jgi:hypothetical protein